MALLEASGIGKNFGETHVLKDISLDLEQGEALAIIGSSGSGKTTLLRCLNFLERPDTGVIKVNGETMWDAADPATQKESEIRKKRLHFGLVFQNFNLFPQYTALQNVMLAGELLAKERPEYQANKKAIHAELEQQAETLQSRLNETAAEKQETAEKAAKAEETAAEWKETANKLENEQLRILAKKEKLEEEKQRITAQMWEEYEMTLRMAQEYTAGLPQEQEQLSVKEWKGKIRALGDVNVGAIEQYKEVKERFEFLTAQREDILAAEEKLRQIIEELSILMEQQFREQFKVISENFSEVFREMFGGGRAQLRLTDAAHVLESPIEIVAQPPGKNLQNMQLLSGGERALTAIAILFSILKMKPSPFCILDEIEAALDDANVSRYAQYLKKFAEETQFIVITHRKGTMEHADVLYGVTMQEKGISKLISVDFSEAEKSITA